MAVVKIIKRLIDTEAPRRGIALGIIIGEMREDVLGLMIEVEFGAGIGIGTITSPGITATATNNSGVRSRDQDRYNHQTKNHRDGYQQQVNYPYDRNYQNYQNPTTLPPGLPPIPPEHQRHSAKLKTAQNADDAKKQRFFAESAKLQNTRELFLGKVTRSYMEFFNEEWKQSIFGRILRI